VVAASLLWLGFLLCVLRGFTAFHGVWGEAPVFITESALYQRLARAPVTAFQELFAHLTATLLARFAAVRDVPEAAFAAEIIALDHCSLDPVLRRLQVLRDVPRGHPGLIPGRLATLFDVRRQLFRRVEYEADDQRNVKFGVDRLLEGLPDGTLLLFDLGYFAFEWFDQLAQRGFWYVSRLRAKTTWVTQHVLYEGGSPHLFLRESWVYLGKYRADRAGELVRLVEVTGAGGTWRYVTNVLDPQVLPAPQLVALYRRRWDIEQSFNLLKTHLHLYLLWSARQNVVILQVFATLILAQVVLALRIELAQRAQAELREVSLPLMLQCLPRLAQDGKDPLAELVEHGRRMKIIRPLRGQPYPVHGPAPAEYVYPAEHPPARKPRYAGKDAGPGRASRPSPTAPPRQRTSGWGTRQRRVGAR
jgi:hypothetical protein